MTENLQINTRIKRLINYIEETDSGYIQIPSFQRDFIWENKQKIELFESIKRGYPIGSLLLWKPKEKYGTSEFIGPYPLPEARENEYFYILDGFQRLSTIYGCLKNPKKAKVEINEVLRQKEYSIYYDLVTEEFFIPRSVSVELTQIPVYTLVDTFEFLTYANKLQNEFTDNEKTILYLERAKELTTIFSDFTLPGIEIIGGKIEDAIEIFTRINSKGSIISPDWMLSALTSNENKDFNLGNLINELIVDLDEFNFGNIKRVLIVQCIQNSFGNIYFDTKIEVLHKRSNFIETTYKTIESIKKAVKFLFEELLVVSNKLLPYNSQLVFITDFFNQIENPSIQQLDILKKWFWQTTYANYFTIYSLSKIREAYELFQKYLQGKTDQILYNDKPNNPFTVIDFPNKIFFGSVRAKALVLFMLNYSHNFKPINADEDCSLKLRYYIHENSAKNKLPENVIPLIRNVITQKGHQKNLGFTLDEKDYNKYFLTEAMLTLDKKGDTVGFLKQRKELIIQAERKFVEELNLVYEQ
ncbi:MAG: DUF262 domain-containing protein [Bacteroidetes bacterium]|jgi:hypothetical protein|nr:DUF262 domain-containing protein [Bacteroidota bacterium]MBT6686740.1 DUF262 domain-containing protein [Bacteroidota bacterium]MBT7145196.1 DUF262 domain-containing protein [Bacteroidota bacterium]MBT7492961.1 DUF262 domain-containing protein [Bacteroidota bacterium]